jgi:putative FmdB family regulatory protein
MPIYGYACKNCSHTLDALQKMSDDDLLECPECGEPALKRQLSAPRFRLKGQGWYETDFKKDNQRNISKSDAQSGSTAKAEKTDKSDKSAVTKSTVKTTAPAKSADSGNKAKK